MCTPLTISPIKKPPTERMDSNKNVCMWAVSTYLPSPNKEVVHRQKRGELYNFSKHWWHALLYSTQTDHHHPWKSHFLDFLPIFLLLLFLYYKVHSSTHQKDYGDLDFKFDAFPEDIKNLILNKNAVWYVLVVIFGDILWLTTSEELTSNRVSVTFDNLNRFT